MILSTEVFVAFYETLRYFFLGGGGGGFGHLPSTSSKEVYV